MIGRGNIEDEDEELLRQYRKDGKPDWLGKIYQRHAVYLQGLIGHMVLNETVAEDLMQNTFVQATRHIDGFNGGSSIKTWLCRIAVNQARGYLRSAGVRRKYHDHLIDLEHTRRNPTPLDSAYRNETNRSVTEAIEKLDPDLRAALVVTVIDERSAAEAAELLNCTRTTVYWRVHQARKQLKALLYDAE